MSRIILVLCLTTSLLHISCKREHAINKVPNDSVSERPIKHNSHKHEYAPHVRPNIGGHGPNIGGHLGQDTITGCFTGVATDSIWIVERVDTVDGEVTEYNYHTESNNPLLPSVELYGRPSQCAFIINEGDLTGDGRDEWAWMRGSFSSNAVITYHLMHFENDNWLEFSIDLDSDTRESGIDVVRKGPTAGSIIISLLYWPEYETPDKVIRCDTIDYPFCEDIAIK